MSNVKWTPAQLSAIHTKADDAAVFAAAGSGKTATLTKRITNLITDPNENADISRMLIVTFTRAATAELKERIRSAITAAISEKGDGRLLRQLYNLPRAKISTIHSFCMSVLRPHYAELSLPPNFRVLDEAEAKVLRKNVMHDVIEEFFEDSSKQNVIEDLADAFGAVKDDGELEEALLKLTDMLASNGIASKDAAVSIENFADTYRNINGKDFLKSDLASPIVVSLERFLDYYRTLFLYSAHNMRGSLKLNEKYVPAAIELLDLIDTMSRALRARDYDALYTVFSEFELSRLASVPAAMQTDVSLYFKEGKKNFSAEAKKLGERFFSMQSSSLESKLRQNADILDKAALIIEKFYDILEREKQRIGALDYGDLEYYTAKLLRDNDGRPTAKAAAVAANFDYVFVDEYQDTNDLQDSIFSSLAECGVKRFIVGDVKQSIYKFRGAKPEIFNSYRSRPQDVCQSIFMSENFRCDPTVISFANFVSEFMFKPTPVPIEEDDLLKAGKSREGLLPPKPVEVVLIPNPRKSSDDGDNEDDFEKVKECDFVANRVKTMLDSEYLADGTKIRGEHIVILVRSPASSAQKYASAFREIGIPVKQSETSDFFTLPEILLALSVLNTVDNPTKEIFLAGAMFSPIFAFDLDQLVRIREYNKSANLWDNVESLAMEWEEKKFSADAEYVAEKCAAFAKQINELRSEITSKSAEKAVYHIFRKTGLLRILKDDGGRSRTNILRLYDMARQMEGSSYLGLYGFLRKIEECIDIGSSPKVSQADESNPDAVTIMSIHSSKGLEFPICFIVDTAKTFNTSDMKNSLMFDSRYGATMRLPDDTKLLRLNTPLRESLSAALSASQTEEEMRVLYVAMTRARERLIITASLPSPEDSIRVATANASMFYSLSEDGSDRDSFQKYIVYSSQNFITWILGAIMKNGTRDSFSLLVPNSIGNSTRACDAPAESSEISLDYTSQVEPILRRLDYNYPNSFLSQIPTKLTVSKLTPSSLDEDEPTALSIDAGSVGESFDAEAVLPIPKFISDEGKPGAAEKGTVTHMFLQFCDFTNIRNFGVEHELDRLIAEEFLPKDAREYINIYSLKKFARSEIFKEMLASDFVKREFRFNALLPAKDFTLDREFAAKLEKDDIKITVQGVFDCVFRGRDGGLLLIDYKTDSLSREEFENHDLAKAKLLARHTRQLTYYKKIAEMIFGEEIKKTLIFSLTLGMAFEV